MRELSEVLVPILLRAYRDYYARILQLQTSQHKMRFVCKQAHESQPLGYIRRISASA